MFKKLKKKYLVWRLDKYKALEKERGYLNSNESAKMLKLRDELYTMMWGRNQGRGFFDVPQGGWKSKALEMDIINEDQVEILPSYYDEEGLNRWGNEAP